MRSARRMQRGMGASGIFFAMVLFAFFLTLLVKLGPSYMSYWTLRSLMDGLAEAPEPIVGGKQAILSRLDGQMNINNIDGIMARDFVVKKVEDNAFDVRVAYERRQHLFANVDVVLTFSHGVTVKAR
jgi:hypothetical protein